MKKILFAGIAVSFLFALGCSQVPREVKDNKVISEMRIEVGNYMSDYQSSGNQESLEKALQINQKLITKYKDKDGFDTNVRIQILFSVGRKKEAFMLMNDIISPDPKNPERLMYRALEHKIKGEKELADQVFEEAIEELDKLIELNPTDPAYITMKITVYMTSGEKEKAWKIVEENHNSKKDDDYWSYIYNNFEKINKNVSETYEGIELD